jgi:predicted protein tyrosine phosphatase
VKTGKEVIAAIVNEGNKKPLLVICQKGIRVSSMVTYGGRD